MLHLVTGGARSGKSRYAENMVKNIVSEVNKPVTYIATATAGDEEMSLRINNHQQDRPKDWELIEEPLYLSKVIEQFHADHILIIECMTLWLSNWLCRDAKEEFQHERQALITQLANTRLNVVIVSNEVGSGITPLGQLSRDFVDTAGWLNQKLAEVADNVTLVVAGCPLSLKSGS